MTFLSDAAIDRLRETVRPARGPRGAATPKAPAGDTVGPYEIQGPLGRGGMGIVYRARHRETGATVALKTVSVERPEVLHGLRREVYALARLRHPGVVRVVDQGAERGLPWYAMDLVEGPSLRSLLGRPVDGAVPVPADPTAETMPAGVEPCPGDPPDTSGGRRAPRPDRHRLLGILVRVCRALAYVHGEGVVHGDLTPENVVVGAGDLPVLMDFGLTAAGAEGRETLHGSAAAGGTPWYVAPERIAGLPLDARADLYALGCILYEVLAGRPPFLASSAAQVLALHRAATPRPPSELTSGVPRELDALCASLLAKDPRRRIGHAETVAAALVRCGAPDDAETAIPARAYLYRPGLVGRDEAVDLLDGCLVQLDEGHGDVVLLRGAAGSGKTRLLMELARESRRRSLLVLLGERTGSAEGAASSEALRQIAREMVERTADAGERDALRGELALLLAPGQAAVVPVSGPAARSRIHHTMLDGLLGIAERRPVVAIVDDLHLADELTVGFLGFLADRGRISGLPLLVVGAYRSEEAPGCLQELSRERAIRSLSLQRLTDGDVQDIVADMTASDPPPREIARAVAAAAEGNPFVVVEYLSAALAEGALLRAPDGSWREAPAPAGVLPMPENVRDLAARRLARLSSDLRQVAELAAVLGTDIDARRVAELASMDEGQVLERLSLLAALHVIDDDDGRLRFSHGILREVLHAELPEDRRRGLHAAAARLLEAEATGSVAARAVHYREAGDRERARDLFLVAARRDASGLALEEAALRYRAHLELCDGPDARAVAVRQELAQMVLRPLGRIPEAMQEQERALQDARALGDGEGISRGLRQLALLHRITGRMDSAEALYREALDRARGTGDAGARASALADLSSFHRLRGDLDAARPLLEEALSLLAIAGHRGPEPAWRTDLASIHQAQGRLVEARAAYVDALALARAAGDRRLQAIVLSNLAALDAREGALPDAAGRAEEALALARAVGDRHTEGVLLLCLAGIDRDRGRAREAETLLERAERLARDVDDLRLQALVLGELGELSFRQGRIAEGRERFARGRALTTASGDAHFDEVLRTRWEELERQSGA